MSGDQAKASISPAAQLLGCTLERGWRVVQRIETAAKSTGGAFSQSYVVESDRRAKAFLKALDLKKAISMANDVVQALQQMTTAFAFEREVCEKCRRERLSNVVSILDHGQFVVDQNDPVSVVPYIIFELGKGDIRSEMAAMDRFDLAWILRTLHQVAVGMKQLHSRDIAHQDLKPSNVVVISKALSKIADLGCASVKGATCPRDDLAVAGALPYAPPEQLYNHVDPDWSRRRLGCDLYLLGNLVVFFFTGVSMTSLLAEEVEPTHRWSVTRESYKTALPYVRDAFGRAVERFADDVPDIVRADLTLIVRQLCDPDPNLRGHPANRLSNRFSLERYVSIFDTLTRKAELNLLR